MMMHRSTNRRNGKRLGIILIGFLLLGNISSVIATGLGELKVESGLNQPFFARVEVIKSPDEVLGNWSVQLLDQDRYEAMGLRYPRDADHMRVTVLQLANGKAEILIEGRNAVTELFVDIVLEMSDGDSSQLRHYPVLIDFPVLETPTQAVTRRPAAAPAPARTTPAAPVRQRSVTNYQAGDQSYGPVQAGDNLWQIANRVRGSSGMSIDELMDAIFELNPDAFMGNDMSRLKVGMPLILPDLGSDHVSSFTPQAARPEPVERIATPGLTRPDADSAQEAQAPAVASEQERARLELQGRTDAASVADSLDKWLESDDAGTMENLSEIRRDLSYAAAEIETYRNENEILKSRIEGLESRVEDMQALLTLQADTIAKAIDPGELAVRAEDLEDDMVDESQDPIADEPISASGPGSNLMLYGGFAFALFLVFGLYVVFRNIREDRMRKEKTLELVNRLQNKDQD
jgi:pilus assembly protein FimV